MILNIGSTVKDGNENIYTLNSIIGRGGFGCVFKAIRENDNAVFAVKTTLPSFGDSSATISFQNEIKSAADIEDKNVIKYEFVHDGSLFPEYPPYIIMEYAEGGTLGDLLKEKKKNGEYFSDEELIDIYKQLASGMKKVNSVLVHRDIKPENILVCGDLLKITDFGLAKIAEECTRTLTFKGGGTPLYMSPEAWDYSKNTIQMDIYSMGIVFYELATFEYPYSTIPKDHYEAKDMHLYTPILNMNTFGITRSQSLVSLINRMLEKSCKKRFSSWEDILTILETQSSPASNVDELVSFTITQKNEEDIERQKRDADIEKEKKDRSHFIKSVYSQYIQTIIRPIIEFADKVNAQYAGTDKLTYSKIPIENDEKTDHYWKLDISANNSIKINFEIVLKENFTKEMTIEDDFDRCTKITQNYIPQYNNKNILGWGKIENSSGFGYNIILIDNDDIYGDWLLMTNHNNFSNLVRSRFRSEPFAFTLSELEKEIDKVQSTYIYSADFDDFTDDTLINIIKQLL